MTTEFPLYHYALLDVWSHYVCVHVQKHRKVSVTDIARFFHAEIAIQIWYLCILTGLSFLLCSLAAYDSATA